MFITVKLPPFTHRTSGLKCPIPSHPPLANSSPRRCWRTSRVSTPMALPHVSPVWVELDGDDIVINTALGRAKARNLASTTRASPFPSWTPTTITPSSPFAASSSASRPLAPTKSSTDWRRSTPAWTPTRIAARERFASRCASSRSHLDAAERVTTRSPFASPKFSAIRRGHASRTSHRVAGLNRPNSTRRSAWWRRAVVGADEWSRRRW
jgi:hypothetical protein